MKRQHVLPWCRQTVLAVAVLGVVHGVSAEGLRVQAIAISSGKAEARILQGLESPTQIDFIDTPLREAINYLKDLHHIEIQLDQRGLKEGGIAADTPITGNLTGVSLRSAFDLILREHNLVWTIQDEALLITTPKAVRSWLTTKVYDLSNLLGQDAAAGHALVEVITTTISPTMWEAAGGAGTAVALRAGELHVLVVAQTVAVHQQLQQLLEALLADKPGAAPAKP